MEYDQFVTEGNSGSSRNISYKIKSVVLFLKFLSSLLFLSVNNLSLFKFVIVYYFQFINFGMIIYIRRKKTTIIFSLQNIFRILLYPSSVAIKLIC